jgi:hypothetical protein
MIVLWNTIYMDAVLDQLRAEGHDVGGVSPKPRFFCQWWAMLVFKEAI